MLLRTSVSRDVPDQALVYMHMQAMQVTAGFGKDVGSTLSAPKSLTAASSPTLRAIMRESKLDGYDRAVPVCVGFRDLGAHLN
eukprot:10009956-Alexandrium_andersonii.AAC.1